MTWIRHGYKRDKRVGVRGKKRVSMGSERIGAGLGFEG
jgi:hypothetical protein